MSKYIVIYEQAEDGGWGAYLPDVPGVIALGKSRGEVGDRLQEAITAYLDELRAEGLPLPEPRSEVGHVAL